ncbi:MAG: hypothetical protein L7W43_07665 [Rubripirellula sp.]|nr:hypothetical protein [Rubripirellula sp.]
MGKKERQNCHEHTHRLKQSGDLFGRCVIVGLPTSQRVTRVSETRLREKLSYDGKPDAAGKLFQQVYLNA